MLGRRSEATDSVRRVIIIRTRIGRARWVEIILSLEELADPLQTNVRGAHFLAEDLAHFDAPFFNITREEAAVGNHTLYVGNMG